MPGSKLDVYKDICRIEHYGEALLRSADIISIGFAGIRGVVDRQILEAFGFTAEMTRNQIEELITQLSQPNVISSTKDIQENLKEATKSSGSLHMIHLPNERWMPPEWLIKIIKYIRDYCLDITFHDRQ